ncbi:FAS1 domain-containing protein [Catenaria anguillulae PL171]|uniref:FAS1 domain-containing protein n=1 Tax=Catenaria anguillulae PL171 TaxID=765915 RepID=A0A1Y2HZ95_9FUNG|nr:FAS1 domain-containing protein [Catenaria anguillulae PL171]
MIRKFLLTALAAATLFLAPAALAAPSAAAGLCLDTPARSTQHVFKYQPRKGDGDESMLDMLRKDRRFSKLVEAIGRAGGNLRDDLEGGGKDKMLLAPVNQAFELMEEQMGLRVKDMSLEDLNKLIMYHVVPGEMYTRDDMCDGELLETALQGGKMLDPKRGDQGQVIRVTKYMNRVVLNMYSQIIDPDMQASNGMIHAITELLIPPRPLFESLTYLPNLFSTHAIALQLTGLADKVERSPGTTALIPTNQAWEALGPFKLMGLFMPENRHVLKSILLKHYIPHLTYIHELIKDETKGKYTAANLCSMRARTHGRRDDDDKEIEKEMPTWGEDKVMIRIGCRGGELRIMVDDVLVSLQDLPAENGVMHSLTSPLIMDDDEDDGGDNDDDDDDDSMRRRRLRRHRAGANKRANKSRHEEHRSLFGFHF